MKKTHFFRNVLCLNFKTILVFLVSPWVTNVSLLSMPSGRFRGGGREGGWPAAVSTPCASDSVSK
jgi:hypothetical protein